MQSNEDLLNYIACREVVSVLDASRPIWIDGQNRKQESFEAFFMWLGVEKTTLIRFCIMDMWKPYLAALKMYRPTTAVLFDKFHVVAKIPWAMDTGRRNEYVRHNGNQRKYIKGQRFNLLDIRKSLKWKWFEPFLMVVLIVENHWDGIVSWC